jgi:hypothetical protein
MYSSIVIKTATAEDNAEIALFRTRQFSESSQFLLRNAALLNESRGETIIARKESEEGSSIISSMQVEYFGNIEALIEIYKPYYKLEGIPSCCPLIHVSKAATNNDCRAMGLNSYLRLLLLKEIALPAEQVAAVTGIVYENGPRVALMRRLGYRSKVIRCSPSFYLVPLSTSIFMWLDRKDFGNAITILEQETKDLLTNYSISIHSFLSELKMR